MDRAASRRLRALRRQLAQPCAGDGDELEEGDLRVAPEPLRAVVRRVLDAAGCEAEQQAVVADHLVLCNLTGHDSHGVQMLPAYIHGVHGGYLVPNKGIAIAGGGDGGPMLTIDGQDAEGKRGFGQSMCREATLLAIERAREHGVCVMGLRRSHHVGRMGTCASLPPPPPQPRGQQLSCMVWRPAVGMASCARRPGWSASSAPTCTASSSHPSAGATRASAPTRGVLPYLQRRARSAPPAPAPADALPTFLAGTVA